MENKIFTYKLKQPTEDELKSVLGASYKLWIDLIKYVETKFGSAVTEWKYYGAKSGWLQKLFLKKRNLLFFIPHSKYFRIGLVFGDNAVSEILQSNLPKEIIEEIKNTKKYAEGTGLRIDVKNKKNLDTVKKLLQIKVKN
ncbi:MAG: DUF3788 domain-containing protein [Ignavibacteriales bacterium]|nr:DUF3788 domain-containing protein [Ignavibacteriales bacterium]